MSKQLFMGSGSTAGGPTTIYANPMSGPAPAGATNSWAVMPIDFTAGTFYVLLAANPGSGNSFTFEMWKNNASTGVSITISDSETTGFDLVNTVSVAAGDNFQIRITQTGTISSTVFHFYWVAHSDLKNYSMLLATTSGNLSGVADTIEWLSPAGYQTAPVSTMNESEIVIPIPGTIRAFYGELSGSTGSGLRHFNIFKNGVNVVVGALFTISTGITGNATGLNISVAAGDLITFKTFVGGSTANTARCTLGMAFEADNDEEFIIPQISTDTIAATGNESNAIYNTTIGWSVFAGDWFRRTRGGLTLFNQYVRLVTAPGSGKSRRFICQKNVANTSLDLTISDTDTTGNVTATVDFAENDNIRIRNLPSGTPAVTFATVSYGAKMPAGFIPVFHHHYTKNIGAN